MRTPTTRRWTRAQSALIAFLAVGLLSGSAIVIEPGITEVMASGTTTAKTNGSGSSSTAASPTTTSPSTGSVAAATTTSGATSPTSAGTSTSSSTGSASTPAGGGNGNTNNGNGNAGNNGQGNAAPKSFTITAAPVTGLFPGGSRTIALTISNPENQDMRITSIVGSVTGTSSAACSASNVSIGAWSAPSRGLVVPKKGTAPTSLQIRMDGNPPNACQNVTFTLRFTGQGAQA
jgi:hypothetical protein